MIKGHCGAELDIEYYTENRLLKTCPYSFTKRGRWNYEPAIPANEILDKKCPECPLSGFVPTGNEFHDKTLAYVKILLSNETKATQHFMAKEACERLPENIPEGHPWASVILASIHLTSKCPSNTDTPLTINETREKVTAFTTHTERRRIPIGVKLLREQGLFPEICLISPLQHIVSRKKELHKFLSPEEYGLVRDTAKKLEKSHDYYKWKQGKKPTTLAAAIVYTTLFFYKIGKSRSSPCAMSQPEVARIFNVTGVSIRNHYTTIEKLLKESLEVPAK